MPILNAADELGQALMREAHTSKLYRYHPIHRSIAGALTALSRGPMKFWIPGASHYMKMQNFTCKTCNGERDWSYTAQLEVKYTR